jgi:hypothetical protein
MKPILLAICAAALLLFGKPLQAANDDAIIYTVKSGDTLIGLGQKYLAGPNDYRKVQSANNVRDEFAIPVGTKLRISRSLLKFKASSARIAAVRGNVTLVRSGSSGTPTTGQIFGEGASLRTAASSFVTIVLENGSQVSLPSNSDLKIVRLRRYVIDSSLDYDFDVGRGGAKSKVTPLTNSNDRYVVKTPKAVTAVRGTEFQSRYDDVSGRDFAEVTTGGLAVDFADGASTPLPAGNGLAVNNDGGVIKEKLLPAPNVSDAGRRQIEKTVRFALPKNADASGMRVAIALDAGFIDQVAEAGFAGDIAEFPAIADGNYFVRFRTVSQNGIEGIPATYGFKRRMNAVSASAGAGDFGYAFKWLVTGNGSLRYRFQLYREKPEGVPFADEAGLANPEISLSDLPQGDYYWRVASVQFLDGEVSTNWTPFEKLTVSGQ